MSRHRRRRAAKRLVALALVCAVAASLWARRSRGGFSTEEVRWANGDVELAGTLYLPDGDGPHPAAAFAPGFGDWTRHDRMFRVHAERLARRGLAMLVYDKRGCGASGGDWRLASLHQLAGDALGAHALLRSHARIDADAVGLFGTSQGALVVVLAANREPSVAFVAAISPAFRTAAEHDPYISAERVRRAGFGDEAAAEAARLQRAIADAARALPPRDGDGGAGDARAEIARLAGDAPWLAAAQLVPGRPGGPRWEALLRAYRDLPLDLDPLPPFEELRAPLFAAQGTNDWIVPGPEGHRILDELRRARDLPFTLVLVPDAEHGLRVPSGFLRSILGEPWIRPDAYWEALDAWLAEATR